MVLGICFPFLVFPVYLVIFNEDLGPSTFVMGDFGVFLGILGVQSSFGRIESEYPVDLRAVVARMAGKFRGIFFIFCLIWVLRLKQHVCLIWEFFPFYPFSVYSLMNCTGSGKGKSLLLIFLFVVPELCLVTSAYNLLVCRPWF